MTNRSIKSVLLGIVLTFSPFGAFAAPDITPPALTQPPVVSSYASGTNISIEFYLDEPCYVFHFYLDRGYGFQMVGQWGPFAGQSLNPASIGAHVTLLSTGRQYYMDCTDEVGNKLTTGTYTIGEPVCAWWDITCVLAPLIDSTPPVISQVAHSNVTATGARFTWTTDEDSGTLVEFGTSTGYGSTISETATLLKNHLIDVVSLRPGTTYHYRVGSRDNAGNTSYSADFSFTTTLPPPPVISNVVVTDITATSARITWTTSTDATSSVAYGNATSYGSTAGDATLTKTHSVPLTALLSGETYHFAASSKDSADQTVTFADRTFATPKPVAGSVTAPVNTQVAIVVRETPVLSGRSLSSRFPAGTRRLMTIEEKDEQGFARTADIRVITSLRGRSGQPLVTFDFNYGGSPDTDHDGLTDSLERDTHRTDEQIQDTDRDGLSDGFEVFVSRSNPLRTDTDSDGRSDAQEVRAQTDPLRP